MKAKRIGCGYCKHEKNCKDREWLMKSPYRKAGGTRDLAMKCERFESEI